MSSAYEKLCLLSHELHLVSDTASLLGWDQEVLLPTKGIAYRAQQMSWFSGYLHERFTSDEVREWLEEAESGESGDLVVAANLREWRHEYDRATRLPGKLVQEFAEVKVHAQSAWAESRKKSDFSVELIS